MVSKITENILVKVGWILLIIMAILMILKLTGVILL